MTTMTENDRRKILESLTQGNNKKCGHLSKKYWLWEKLFSMEKSDAKLNYLSFIKKLIRFSFYCKM